MSMIHHKFVRHASKNHNKDSLKAFWNRGLPEKVLIICAALVPVIGLAIFLIMR